VLGYFTLAHKILTAPLTFVGTTVSQIFYEKAARAKEKGMNNLKSITLKLTGVIGVLSIIPCLVIVIWGKEIFELVFGSHYAIAGHYARWIMPWITLTYLVSPLSFLVNVKRKLKFDLLYNITLFITRIIVLVIGGYYFSAETSIAIFCMVGLCFNLFLLLWLIQISGQSENEYAG
jgi:O-antigen/teichoic acid export membrane protein